MQQRLQRLDCFVLPCSQLLLRVRHAFQLV